MTKSLQLERKRSRLEDAIIDVISGLMQAGKTTEAILLIKSLLSQKNNLIFMVTHMFKGMLYDLLFKLEAEGIKDYIQVNGIDGRDKTRASIKKLKHDILDEKVSSGLLVGINNDTFYEKIAHLMKVTKGKVEQTLILDEGDVNEIDFNFRFQRKHRRNNSIDAELRNDPPDKTIIISASMLGLAISETNYENVKLITPGEGYNNNFSHGGLYEKDIEELKSGSLRDGVIDLLMDTNYNSMINIDTHTKVHEIIAYSLKELELYTSSGKLIVPMIINQNSKIDYELANDPSVSVCYISGNLASRGQTFPGLQTLIIDKGNSHQAATLQAAGRLFGYKNYPLVMGCTTKQLDKINTCLDVEERIRNEEIISLKWEERHDWVSNLQFHPNFKVFSNGTGNAHREVLVYDAFQPKWHFKDLPLNYKHDITIMIVKKEGTPHPTQKIGTRRWGVSEIKNKNEQYRCESLLKTTSNHPQGGGWSTMQKNGNILRKYVILPHGETHVDPDTGQSFTEYTEGQHNDPNGSYLEQLFTTQEERENIKTLYVASQIHDGTWLIWDNLNLKTQCEKEETKKILISDAKPEEVFENSVAF